MVVRERALGRRQRAQRAAFLTLGVAGLVASSACTGSATRSSPVPDDTLEAAPTVAAADTPVTVAAASSALATNPPPTDAPPTTPVATEPPSTEAPPTEAPPTEAPTTTPPTPAPTTEAAPPTTVAATTTTAAPLPLNRVPTAPLGAPLAVVGESSGPETARIQQRLLDLGFWLTGVDGSYGLTTRQAVMAFQKYVGLTPSGTVDEPTAAFLSGLAERAYGRADSGTLVEIDKTRQLLMFVVDGRTQWVFNTSTGNGESYIEEDQNSPGTLVEGVSLTPDGLHKVNRERPEGWWEGDLGQIYRPKYFVGGVAVHGSNSVPDYPASHGCVRVTVEAMDYIWETGLMPMRLPVWVHEQPRA